MDTTTSDGVALPNLIVIRMNARFVSYLLTYMPCHALPHADLLKPSLMLIPERRRYAELKQDP